MWRLSSLGLFFLVAEEKSHTREEKTLPESPTDLQAKTADTSLAPSAPCTANGNYPDLVASRDCGKNLPPTTGDRISP
jgi:hypothetical protein